MNQVLIDYEASRQTVPYPSNRAMFPLSSFSPPVRGPSEGRWVKKEEPPSPSMIGYTNNSPLARFKRELSMSPPPTVTASRAPHRAMSRSTIRPKRLSEADEQRLVPTRLTLPPARTATKRARRTDAYKLSSLDQDEEWSTLKPSKKARTER